MKKEVKEYTPEQYQQMRGKKIYTTHDGRGKYCTSDGYIIMEKERISLKKLLDIIVVVVDDAGFMKRAQQAYEDVYEAEFRDWVKRNPNPKLEVYGNAVPHINPDGHEDPFFDEKDYHREEYD